MSATIIDPPGLPPPRGYANGVLLGPGRMLFVAGQIAWDQDGQLVGGEDFAAQFAQALTNVRRVVEAAGGTVAQIGRLTIYVTDKGRYLAARKDVGVAYRRVMGRHFPAMSLVEVAALLEAGAQVEIEATAVVP
jgi:enamine deaminase RidA (YjgF/YER057c/UK114 family)